MTLNVDDPIEFESTACGLCKKSDDKWFLMQLLADGVWRKLEKGKSLREQGLDEDDANHHVYCIHECTENVIRGLCTDREVNAFQLALREHAGR